MDLKPNTPLLQHSILVQGSLSLLFKRQPVLPIGIALFAGRHQIASSRFSAANDRNQVIHRQLFRQKLLTTVMADPGRTLALPPLARTQLPRLLALPANFFFGDFY